MKPVSPVIPRERVEEVVYGEGQPEYIPLPAVKTENGGIVTRWKCSAWDRIKILFNGNVYHHQMTFDQPMQPIRLQTKKPKVVYEFCFSTNFRDWLLKNFNIGRKFGWIRTPYGWLSWEFYEDSSPRIWWSKDGTTLPGSGVRVIKR